MMNRIREFPFCISAPRFGWLLEMVMKVEKIQAAGVWGIERL